MQIPRLLPPWVANVRYKNSANVSREVGTLFTLLNVPPV